MYIHPFLSRLIIPLIESKETKQIGYYFLMHSSSHILSRLRAERLQPHFNSQIVIKTLYRFALGSTPKSYSIDINALTTPIRITKHVFQILLKHQISRFNAQRLIPYIRYEGKRKCMQCTNMLAFNKLQPIEATIVSNRTYKFDFDFIRYGYTRNVFITHLYLLDKHALREKQVNGPRYDTSSIKIGEFTITMPILLPTCSHCSQFNRIKMLALPANLHHVPIFGLIKHVYLGPTFIESLEAVID